MYLQHFGLSDTPFSITPDTQYFLNRAGYQDALNVLLVALRSGEGFIKVTGEVGTGKTMLCRKLINTLQDDFVTAYIHNPYIEPDTLLFSIADDLEIDYPDDINQHRLLKRITSALMDFHARGRPVVLCLDEVQAMPVETLESLRLLTNLETERRKLMQVVLFGQPELDDLLDQPSVRQLKQRITFSYRLDPMNTVCLKNYIRHRLMVAGYRDGSLFSRSAMDMLIAASGGIPRLVNILCHKAMMAAYGKGRPVVSGSDMRAAVRDTVAAQALRRAPLRALVPGFSWWLAGGMGVALLTVTILLTGIVPGGV